MARHAYLMIFFVYFQNIWIRGKQKFFYGHIFITLNICYLSMIDLLAAQCLILAHTCIMCASIRTQFNYADAFSLRFQLTKPDLN